MDEDLATSAARTFARNLNILLKTVRLYGFGHERTAGLLNTSWKALGDAMQHTGESGLLLGVSGSRVLLDGVPLEKKPTDLSFAQLLSSAGLSSIHFMPQVTADQFARFVAAFASLGPKSPPLGQQLKSALGEGEDVAIHVNELRYVAQDPSMPEGNLAAVLAARTLGPEADKLRAWLNDPQKLLQLIAAAEGAQRLPQGESPGAGPAARLGPAGSTASSVTAAAVAPVAEEDVLNVIRLLSQIGQNASRPEATAEVGQFRSQVEQLPPAAQVTLTQALTSIATASPPASPDIPLLVQLAERVAIQFALERYQRGDIRINAVVELLDRMKREIRSLRQVLTVREETMGKAGLDVETHEEILDRQFWASVPEVAKRKVLQSPEAWAIPPRNVRQYVEELLTRGDADSARIILNNYVSCVHNPDPQARKRVASGLIDLTDLFIRAEGPVLASAIRHLGERLKHEGEAELQALLGAALVRFSHEAASHRRYPALQQALISVESVEQLRPNLAQQIWPRIRVVNRLNEFIAEAVSAPEVPVGLVEVLQRMPHASVEQLTAQFVRRHLRKDCDRLVELAQELGPEGIFHLSRILETRPAPEAAATVGLLSRLDLASVEIFLPKRLRVWEPIFHDQSVRQLVCGGSPSRGKLLLKLMEVLNSAALPETLDEIGMSGERAGSSKLLQMVEAELAEPHEPYLCIKAIEALGRLREAKASSVLRPCVEARQFWQWRHPRELRISAAQALAKIDPDWAGHFIPQSGLSEPELRIAPLDPLPDAPWVRQRRYQRVQLPHTLKGAVNTSQGDCPVAICELSLGGGVAACQRHLKAGIVTRLEFRPGLRPVHAEVLVRAARPQQFSFELVKIELEDRSKLRRPLAGLQPQPD